MNILIFDQEYNNNPTDYVKPLVDNIKGLNASIFEDLQKAQEVFKNDTFDFIIVDFSTQDGEAFLKHLLEIKPKQKIITLAYELRSSENSCDECELIHNKRRLIKPIDALEVYKTIKNFDTQRCKYVNHFLNPSILVEDLLNRYDYFKYNKDTHTIEKHTYENDLILREYIDIIDALKKYNIAHEIIDEYKVKIV